ncbi:hypothetical protein BN1708_007402 [Verticillium longisporum]|uniref:Uncharacterized protein n=1 Tax=Verticillium longisporum TaxID=100787 RepID=A0A0G4MU44_VERLO|nr:hypothetical protein BN1708_007402 [Verticillium longisporum]
MSDTTDESDDDYMYGDEVDSNDSEADPFNCTAKEQTSATPVRSARLGQVRGERHHRRQRACRK